MVEGELKSPLLGRELEAGRKPRALLVIVTSDRGLCGAFNGSVIKAAQNNPKVMNANGYDVTIDDTGVILVDTFEAIAARQATIPLDTRTLRLNYSRAASV